MTDHYIDVGQPLPPATKDMSVENAILRLKLRIATGCMDLPEQYAIEAVLGALAITRKALEIVVDPRNYYFSTIVKDALEQAARTQEGGDK